MAPGPSTSRLGRRLTPRAGQVNLSAVTRLRRQDPPASPAGRREPPPPLEANDQIVAAVVTAVWVVALVVLLAVRASLRAGERWWIWTAVAGIALGLFGLVYIPVFKRSRSAAAARRAAARATPDDQVSRQADGRASGLD